MNFASRKQIGFSAILSLMLLLAACGGSGDGTVIVPTRVSIAESTAQVTPPTPSTAQALTSAPALPPPSTPSLDVTAQPNAEATEPAFAGPPGLPSAATQQEGEIIPSPSAIDDFSTLTVGEEALLIGELSLAGEAGQPQTAVLTDAQGNQVELVIPPGMANEFAGLIIEVFGQIVDMAEIEGAADATAEAGVVTLGIRPNSMSPAMVAGANPGLPPGLNPDSTGEAIAAPEGFPGAVVPEGTSDVSMPPFMASGTMPAPPFGAAGPEGTANAVPFGPGFGGPGMIQGELLEETFDPNLTALEAYDAVVEAFADDLGERSWIIARGSNASGWSFEFYSETDDTTITYSVDPEGAVRRTPASPSLPLPGMVITPIDRELIVVDSDEVIASATTAGGPPVTDLMLLLSASGDAIQWTALSGTPVIIDATQAIELQVTPTARP